MDDDRAVREALSDLLQVEGYETRTFPDGAAFLSASRETEFDCLITDVRMPGIDGIELQHLLRDEGFLKPVIFITSAGDEQTREKAARDGAFSWFTKPVTDEELLTALRQALACGPGGGPFLPPDA